MIRANLTERIWKYTSDNEVLRKENWTEKIITELMVSAQMDDVGGLSIGTSTYIFNNYSLSRTKSWTR